MARPVAKSDPALAIEFFLSGFYTYRSQLFAPFRGIGVNVVSFHDPVIDGENMEDTDLFQWTRRPGFSIFCPVPLAAAELVNQFYSNRNLDGEVVSVFDSNQRLAQFTSSTITTIFNKTPGAGQGFVTQIGNFAFFSDSQTNDFQMWDTVEPLSTINPSPWGIPAPTLTPTIFSPGCWLPFVNKVVNNAILDPNGNVEVVTAVTGGSGITGGNEPPWPTTLLATVGDGSVTWTNMGPLLSWLPDTNFPVPVVISDTNGNLELATTVSSTVSAWNSATAYTVGETVLFGGNFWTALVNNTNVPPSSNYIVTSGSTQQPYWVLSQNPIQTGSTTPVWNKTVGGTTSDGSYMWTNLGPGTLIESFGTSYVYCYRTIYGHLSTASPVSLNTGSIFGPQVVAITGYSITGNVVTFQGTNNFIPGNAFTVQGFTSQAGLAMNNQPFTVLPNGLSPTQFEATFVYANTPATTDAGSTVNLIATITGAATSSALCNSVVSINATQVVAGVVTVYAANNFAPGIFVTFSGVSVATFLNGVQFQVINVDPNGTWFQVYFTTDLGIVPPNQNKTTDTGTATFNAIEIYRTSDGGGIYLFAGAVTNPVSSGGPSQTFDTGFITAGEGTDNGTPGTHVWANPNNVTSASSYATVSVPSPVSGSGRFAVVQNCQNIFNDNPGKNTTPQQISATFGSSVTGGNTIIVCITTFQVGAWQVTDSNGNSYTQLASQASSNDHGFVYNLVYRATNVAAGPTTVTLTVSMLGGTEAQYWGFQAFEVSGLNGTYEGPASVYQASGTTLNSGTLTTTNPNSVVFSTIWSDLNTQSGSPAQAPSGYTLAANQVVHVPTDGESYQQQATAFQVQSATGTFSPTWSTPVNSKGIGITIAFDLNIVTPSDGLDAQEFSFSVPPSIQVTGIAVDFDALVSASVGFAILEVQLLRAGAPYGNPKTITPTTSNVTYSLGGAGDVWGAIWVYSDFNNEDWGVQFTALQNSGGSTATFSVRHVQVRLLGQTNTAIWVFNDFTTDENLNELLIAPQNHQNDPPPGANGSSVTQTVGGVTAYWNGRMWMASGNYVYYTAGPDCTNGDPNSSWPPANRFQFAGPPITLVPSPDGAALIVCLADRYNAILGGPETISFYPTDVLSNFGVSNPNALFKDGSTIGQFTTQGQYVDLIGQERQDTGEHVADYLEENFSSTLTYATMHRDGLDVGTFVSNGVDRVLRYGNNISAWSVPSFPIGGAGALRSIETSVGVYSLMLASPVPTTIRTTPLTNPTSGTNGGGSGVAWTNPGNITSGNPTNYATVLLTAGQSSQTLIAQDYDFNIPATATIQGIEVTVTGKQTAAPGTLTITPLNAVPGAESDVINLTSSAASYTVGGPTDLWGMPTWITQAAILAEGFGFQLTANYSIGGGGGGVYQFADTIEPNSGVTTISTPSLTPNVNNMLAIFSVLSRSGIGPITPNATWNTATQINISSEGSILYMPLSSTSSIAGGGTVAFGFGWISTLILLAPVGISAPTVSASINGSATITAGSCTTGNFADSAGQTIILFVDNSSNTVSDTHALAVSDSEGNTYTQISDLFDSVWPNRCVVFIASNIVGSASNVITIANASDFGSNLLFAVLAVSNVAAPNDTVSVSEVQVKVFYSNPTNYLRARDLQSWGDNGQYGKNNGTPYTDCFITLGSITLTQPGAVMFPLQHVVGYFDAVGTLGEGGTSSPPNIWILPNEISDTAGIGFIQLPEFVQEPPEGQNKPSASLQALRWPLNMMNSDLASQFVHHLQVKVEFGAESAPNTIKAIAFKQEQE